MIRSWDAYQALFFRCPADRVCGEASVLYPYSPQACRPIHRRIPKIRLVALPRYPADHALSAYLHDRLCGVEPCTTFAEALAEGPRRENERWLIGAHQSLGYYARHLRPWLETFDPSQLCIYLYDDLVNDPSSMITNFYRFLGVDAGFLPDLSKRFNVTGVIENPLWRLLWNGTRGLRSHLITLAPMSLRGSLVGLVAHLLVRKAALEAFDPALRRRLTAV